MISQAMEPLENSIVSLERSVKRQITPQHGWENSFGLTDPLKGWQVPDHALRTTVVFFSLTAPQPNLILQLTQTVLYPLNVSTFSQLSSEISILVNNFVYWD